ncbi:MAG: DUF2786 domain-containing protein [Fluviibacter sp.]
MDSKKQKMTDIVAKLLRQAEDVVGTPEEQVFQAKAFELMAKYGLEIAMVEAHKGGLDVSQLPDAVKIKISVEGKYAYQQLLLLHNISQSLHCKNLYSTVRSYDGQPARYVMTIFGMPRHTERVEMLWGILRPQMLRQVAVVRPAYDYNAGRVKSFRRAWIAGFGSSIGERIRAEENKVIESAAGALVLYQDDKQRAEIALRAEYPRVTRGRQSSGYNSEGYSRGRADGQRAAFNHSIAG